MSTIVCSPCLRNDKTEDCVKYCLECNENLCRTCFREHVKKFSTSLHHHRLIGKDEMPEWLIGRQCTSLENTKCSVHPENDLDLVCNDHDVICCGACAVTVHSLCSHIVDLNDTESLKEREDLMSECVTMIGSLTSLITKGKQNQSTLRKSTSESLKSLRRFRTKINDTFDRLEREMVEEIDTKCIESDNVIENNKKDMDKAIALLELTVEELRSTKDDNENVAIYIGNVNARKMLKTTKTLQEKIEKGNLEKVNFIANKPLENYIDSLKNIGFCTSRHNQQTTSTVEERELETVHELPFDFQDAIQTASGDILLLDTNIRTIVRLTEDYSLCQTYNLLMTSDSESFNGDPFAFCCVENDQVAVTLVRDMLIKIFDLDTGMEKQRTIQVNEYCRGIAYDRTAEEMFVSCGGGSLTNEGLGHIRVYNMQGELLRSFRHGADIRTPLTVRPLHLAISNDCSKIFICDDLKGVICIDTHGTVIAQYSTSSLEEARGLCVDQNDRILLTGCGSDNILRIETDMKSHESIVTDGDVIKHPQAICYDSKHNVCVVSSIGSNCLYIVHL